MTQQSTAEVERDKRGQPVVPPRRRSKRLLRREVGNGVHRDEHRDGDGDDSADVELSPEQILKLIMTELAVEPPIAGAALGVGRNSSYKACHLPKDDDGHINSYWVGNKLMCPTAPIRKKLRLEPSSPVPAPAVPEQTKPVAKQIKPPRNRLSR